MSVAITTSGPADEVCEAAAQRVRAVAAATPIGPITPAVDAVLAALERLVPRRVIRWPDGSGGAHVFLTSVDLGPPFVQATSWLAFHLPYTLPDGDIYPTWIRPDLARLDGGPLGKADAAGQTFLHQNQTWLSEPAVMISLRSKDRDPAIDSPLRKLGRVLTTLRST